MYSRFTGKQYAGTGAWCNSAAKNVKVALPCRSKNQNMRSSHGPVGPFLWVHVYFSRRRALELKLRQSKSEMLFFLVQQMWESSDPVAARSGSKLLGAQRGSTQLCTKNTSELNVILSHELMQTCSAGTKADVAKKFSTDLVCIRRHLKRRHEACSSSSQILGMA